MEKRIAAGQKKFAQRYSRIGNWQHAATLYEGVLVKHSKDTKVLRNLAACFKNLGDEQGFVAANSKAIRFDMIRYGRNPRRVSVNLSLFESFRQGGNGEKARFHLTRAVQESRDKVVLEPYNAGNFYWLGKCLLAQGDPVAAGEHFARAVSMKPASKKYQRAYLKSQQRWADSLKVSEKGRLPLCQYPCISSTHN